AEKCHFNSSYFSSLFKQHTGIGYLDYLTTIRIDQAACLLRQSNMPIHRLSARVGYPNTAYFIKLFRAKYGLTPVEYRKAEQK
ncbi:MAG: helix-turn-helix transcriptional regulator, partial [Clostridia bacterium]